MSRQPTLVPLETELAQLQAERAVLRSRRTKLNNLYHRHREWLNRRAWRIEVNRRRCGAWCRKRGAGVEPSQGVTRSEIVEFESRLSEYQSCRHELLEIRKVCNELWNRVKAIQKQQRKRRCQSRKR